MSNELTCPVCGSHNCWCDEKPTHQHRCLDCKYDGTEPIEWAAVRLCREQREEIERLREQCVYLESDAALVAAEEFAKEGWAWVDEFCRLAGVADVFKLRELLAVSSGDAIAQESE